MGRLTFICSAFIAMVFAVSFMASASEIVLKSGQKFEGNIVEQTSKYIKIDTGLGVAATYYTDDIDTIDGKKLSDDPMDKPSIEGQNDAQTVIYFKSGEIIKGKLIKKIDQSIEIEKQGNTLTFNMQDVSHIGEWPIQADSRQLPKLPFSTAIITYQISGNKQGKEMVFIDVKNNRIDQESYAIYASSPGCPLKIKENNREIYDGKNRYILQFKDKIAIQEPIKKNAIRVVFHENLLADYYEGQGAVLGKMCNIYKTAMGESYFWHGILLKQIISFNSFGRKFSDTKEAVSIMLNVPIADEKFQVPAGLKVVDTQEAMSYVTADFQNAFEKLRKKLQNARAQK